MINFESNNIFVGYIKELLSSFHLPIMRIYKENVKLIHNSLYIKDGNIEKYDEELNKFTYIDTYKYNKCLPNYTKTLKSDSLTYDSHTHRYLGDYLRFFRDYHNLDLMSLYNCYNNEIPKKLYKEIKLKDIVTEFDVQNETYKIFMIPVKFDCEYTIAIDSELPYEMFCSYYGKKYYDRNNLAEETYQKVTSSNYLKPYLFSKLKSDLCIKSYHNEYDLKLFIKLPCSNSSTITILEGNYTSSNDFVIDNNDPYKLNYNKYIINYEKINELQELNIKGKNQLLSINSGYSYPFADRLIEYLTGNVITHLDPVQDNVKRFQKKLLERYNKDPKNKTIGLKYLKDLYGVWTLKYKFLIYDIMSNESSENNWDILGYVDKDVEKLLGPDIDIYEEN